MIEDKIRRTDGGELALDDTVLKDDELEAMGIDPADFAGGPLIPEKHACAMLGIDDKELRQKCFELLERDARTCLDDKKRGYNLDRLLRISKKPPTGLGYLEVILGLMAVSSRIGSLESYLAKIEPGTRRYRKVSGKLSKISYVEKMLLDACDDFSRALFGIPTNKKETRQMVRTASRRKLVNSFVKRQFIDYGVIEPI